MIFTFFAILLIAQSVRAETLQWAGGGKNGGYLAVHHHGIRENARSGDPVWMTGPYDRFVSRYVALDWTLGKEHPGQILMDGYGDLCLDAGRMPRRGAQVKVAECAEERMAEQTWVFADNQVRLADTELCLEVHEESERGNVRLATCKGCRFTQWWSLKSPSRSFTVQGPMWV